MFYLKVTKIARLLHIMPNIERGGGELLNLLHSYSFKVVFKLMKLKVIHKIVLVLNVFMWNKYKIFRINKVYF